jgi:hypothetical protein
MHRPCQHHHRDGRATANAIALAVDGAIVRAQMDESPEPALGLLEYLPHTLRRELPATQSPTT